MLSDVERTQESAHGLLIDYWTRLTGDDADVVVRDLLARYSEPHRHYHTTGHLLAVLDLIDELSVYAEDADAVRLAAWFHDAVYDPARGDNEERSARLAERALNESGLPQEYIEETARLVRETVLHAPAEGDRNAAVLCDADLAILGADKTVYEQYAAAVRQEYHFVPEEAFRTARAAILRDLLELPTLFHTPLGVQRYEERARANVRAELSRLEGSIPQQTPQQTG
jgi:predicted metal-dependent HD superfamily phosphohydrolase